MTISLFTHASDHNQAIVEALNEAGAIDTAIDNALAGLGEHVSDAHILSLISSNQAPALPDNFQHSVAGDTSSSSLTGVEALSYQLQNASEGEKYLVIVDFGFEHDDPASMAGVSLGYNGFSKTIHLDYGNSPAFMARRITYRHVHTVNDVNTPITLTLAVDDTNKTAKIKAPQLLAWKIENAPPPITGAVFHSGNIRTGVAYPNAITMAVSTTDYAIGKAMHAIPATGQYYWEIHCSEKTLSGNTIIAGICEQNPGINDRVVVGITDYVYASTPSPHITVANASSAYSAPGSYGIDEGDTLQFMFDADTKNLWVGSNGVWHTPGDPETLANPIASAPGWAEYRAFVQMYHAGTTLQLLASAGYCKHAKPSNAAYLPGI